MFDGLTFESLLPKGFEVMGLFDNVLEIMVILFVTAYVLKIFRNTMAIRKAKTEDEGK